MNSWPSLPSCPSMSRAGRPLLSPWAQQPPSPAAWGPGPLPKDASAGKGSSTRKLQWELQHSAEFVSPHPSRITSQMSVCIQRSGLNAASDQRSGAGPETLHCRTCHVVLMLLVPGAAGAPGLRPGVGPQQCILLL